MTQYQTLGFQKYIIFFPCWRCNLKCPYCAYNPKPQEHFVSLYGGKTKMCMKELPPSDWTRFLSSYKNSLIEICGGEPLLYKGLPDIIDSLHHTCRYAMTSNTSQMKTVFKLNPNNCYSWTSSFHPSSPPPYSDLNFFLGLLQEMKRYGYRNVACTIVYLPWKHIDEYIIEMQKRFKKENIPLNWQPYMWPNYKWKPDKLSVALKLMPSYRAEWDNNCLKHCDAGNTSFAVNSNGNIYRCLSNISFNGDILGNINGGWKPIKPVKCSSPCVWTCDYWNNNVKYLD